MQELDGHSEVEKVEAPEVDIPELGCGIRETLTYGGRVGMPG